MRSVLTKEHNSNNRNLQQTEQPAVPVPALQMMRIAQPLQMQPKRNEGKVQMQPVEEEEETLQMSLQKSGPAPAVSMVPQNTGQPLIQRNGPAGAPGQPASGGGSQPLTQANPQPASPGAAKPASGTDNKLGKMVAKLIRDQTTDKKLEKHFKSLGKALQGLAIEGSAEQTDQPKDSAERLAALGIEKAFETTAKAIILDAGFKQFRQKLIDIIGSSDEAALITLLAGGLAAYLADVKLTGSPSFKLGAGFSTGGKFDLGSAQDIRFKKLEAYVQYANSYFRTRITGSVSRDKETNEFLGTGTGQLRLGDDMGNLTGTVSIDSQGKLILSGKLTSGFKFEGTNNKLIFTTDVSHLFSTGETIIKPGLSGKFTLGHDQSLRIGTNLQIATGKGLTGATGFLEYNRSGIRLRIEGNMAGIPDAKSMVPGRGMTIQGTLTIPLF